MTAAVPTIRAAHRENFTTEGASGRGAWAALAPRTLAERARLGFGPGPILTRTGALRAHVLGRTGERDPPRVPRRATDRTGRVGRRRPEVPGPREGVRPEQPPRPAHGHDRARGRGPGHVDDPARATRPGPRERPTVIPWQSSTFSSITPGRGPIHDTVTGNRRRALERAHEVNRGEAIARVVDETGYDVSVDGVR